MTDDHAPQAWVNDGLVALADARVSVLDAGFRTGEGVFETIRVYGSTPFRLADHLLRASHGASRLGFDLPEQATIRAAVQATIEANAAVHTTGDTVVRLTLTPGGLDPASPWPLRSLGTPTLVVTSHQLQIPAAIYEQGVRAVVVPWGREAPDVKAVSYLAASLARRHAHAAGADEALLTDGHDHVLEGSASNVFAIDDGVLLTPPVTQGLLPGVTRATVLQVAEELGIAVREELLPLQRLLRADEAFLTASTREVVPLVRIDDVVIGAGEPGAATKRLHQQYRALVRRETGGN